MTRGARRGELCALWWKHVDFSSHSVGRTHLLPSSITQRYRRMAERLKIKTNFYNLRHYSAAELIAAGVDIRTVAGRLRHGGGGTTTLRVYAAWAAEADQRAATGTAQRAVALLSSWGLIESAEGSEPSSGPLLLFRSCSSGG